MSARRADGVEILRRGQRALAVSDVGRWREVDATDLRLLAQLEQSRPVRDLVRRSSGDDVRERLARLFAARLITLNGRAAPPEAREAPSGDTLPTVSIDHVHELTGTALVHVPPERLAGALEALAAASHRGAFPIPFVIAGRAEDFIHAFDLLTGAGFRVFRLVPPRTESQAQAADLAQGYVALARHATEYVRRTGARLRISGLDAWIHRLHGFDALPRFSHPRCGRCPVRAFCRPDRWPDDLGDREARCAFARHLIEPLLWMLVECPDLYALSGRDRCEMGRNQFGHSPDVLSGSVLP